MCWSTLDKKPSSVWGSVQAHCQLKSCKMLHKCSTDCIWKGLQPATATVWLQSCLCLTGCYCESCAVHNVNALLLSTTEARLDQLMPRLLKLFFSPSLGLPGWAGTRRINHSGFPEAKMMGWKWQQLGHMQVICTFLQGDNHASTSSFKFLRVGCSSCCPTNSVKVQKATVSVLKCMLSLHISSWENVVCEKLTVAGE